jgi:hypothetical protein
MVLLLEELLKRRKGHHHLSVRSRLIAGGLVQQAIGRTAQKHTTCFAQGEEAGQVLPVSQYAMKAHKRQRSVASGFAIGGQR